MAKQAGANELYSNAPGGLDITWFKNNFFTMNVIFPYDVSPYSYEGKVLDKFSTELASMNIAVTASGLYSGTINCTMSGNIIDTLPPSSTWYLDQITTSNNRRLTMLGGLFSVKEKGEA